MIDQSAYTHKECADMLQYLKEYILSYLALQVDLKNGNNDGRGRFLECETRFRMGIPHDMELDLRDILPEIDKKLEGLVVKK